MVVLIVLIACGSTVIRQYLITKRSRYSPDLENRVAAIEASLDENNTLESRVQALEKIVTDQTNDLKREINSL